MIWATWLDLAEAVPKGAHQVVGVGEGVSAGLGGVRRYWPLPG
jgi:hypothetical protein